MKPLISIVIPTYKRPIFLTKVINCILRQSYKNYEIIVVDDDPDSTLYNRLDWLKQNKKIKYIKHTRNRGASAARNTGIKNSIGEYIALLDDDDLWLPQKLEKQVSRFIDLSPKVGVVYCGYYKVYNEQIIHEEFPILKGKIYKYSLKKCPIGSPTPLIKRECFEKVGLFDERLPSCQDWDLWIRIAKFYDFDFVPEILAVHCCHGAQISVDLNKKIVGREMILKKYEKELTKYPDIFSWHLRRLGSLYCLKGDIKKSRKYFLTSLKANPFNIGSWIHIALSYISVSFHRAVIKKYGLTKINDFFIIN